MRIGSIVGMVFNEVEVGHYLTGILLLLEGAEPLCGLSLTTFIVGGTSSLCRIQFARNEIVEGIEVTAFQCR